MSGFDVLDGACGDLNPRVYDKYFDADASRQPFEYMTAKAICGRCVVQAECLADAIMTPSVQDGLIRGGQSRSALRNLRVRHVVDGEPLAELVRHTIATSVERIEPRVAKGNFPDPELVR